MKLTDEQQDKLDNMELSDVIPWLYGIDSLDDFRCGRCGQCYELCFCEDGDDL